MKYKRIFQKLLTTLLVGTLLFANIAGPVAAQEAPPPPPAAPEAPPPPPPPPQPPDPPAPPVAPTPPSEPGQPPTAPTPPPATEAPTPPPGPAQPSPRLSAHPYPETTPDPSPGAVNQGTTASGDTDSGSGSSGTTANNSAPVLGTTTGSQDASHGNGDPSINTGDANTSGALVNSVNTNGAGTINPGSGTSGDIAVNNTGNGAGSSKSGDVSTNNNSSTVQTNDANVNNQATLASVSGKNDSSYNVGPTQIIAGDANTTATVINGVNTNLSGVNVIEFNIDDTHRGDIVLAPPIGGSSGCNATVCGVNGQLTAANSGNGANSTNDAAITNTNTDKTFQTNTADVTTDLTLLADSGHNQANYNTGGDNKVQTGNANAVATVANLVNNSIAGVGNVIVNVVNVFGDLIGNIILPKDVASGEAVGGSGLTAVNSGNGANSTNTAGVTATNASTTTQTNVAHITNNIDVAATTGKNKTENNTAGFVNGNNAIESGDATVNVNTVNIANSNVVGGDIWWLVFVNDASGNWVGHIVGSPNGAAMAGSVGTEFVVAPDGSILAKNTGNGAGSTNTATVTNNNSTTTTQTNTANVTNNITLDANSGKNTASYNTGGASSIKTGDANVMANILNFVNNNFVGGKVVVSVVNVFGSWLGSFVPPGGEAPAIGGSDTPANTTQPSEHHDGGNSGNSAQSTNAANTGGSAVGAGGLGAAITGLNLFTNRSGGQANVAGATDEGDNQPPKHTIVEDNSILVPAGPKTAGAKTTIPSWFWKMFALGLALIIVKKGAKSIKIKKEITPAI